ncbi:MAG TPA: tryptophan 7-halogenase [Blastocatellia bacterium]
MASEQFDLIAVGGGPAGSTVSTFVAMQGHKVLLLEREKFPRYQIGESLLPATVHGICVMLGVTEQLKEARFTIKRGGTFRWGTGADPWTFAFASPTIPSPTGYAYQVERSKFDSILLDNARSKGVEVREGYSVKDLLRREDGRVIGIIASGPDGRDLALKGEFVVDASGNTSRLHGMVGERVYSKFFKNLALFCYYKNGKRLPPPNSGNILCAAFEGGWFWYIPLSRELTSVGAVVSHEYDHRLNGGYEAAMQTFIDSCPLINEYLKSATRVTEGEYGRIRVRKDYSYTNTRFWVPGIALVGDAACFVDPVFSSGVHLATYSALLAARSINTILRGDLEEHSCFREFEWRYRREYANFYEFLMSFYDMHQDTESYFWSARKVLNTGEKANDAFIRLVAGVGSSGEPLYESAEAFFRQTTGAGDRFQEFADKGISPTSASNSFNEEIIQIQTQASLGERRAAERPMFDGGLIPTTDGFHWRRPSIARVEQPVPPLSRTAATLE